MSESFRALGGAERDQLAECLALLAAARARLRDAQSVAGRPGVYRLRMDLVAALEAYERLLTGLGVPLPRQLRGELDLQRGIGHHN